ncbi:succinyl-CoA:glutarate CoA-transferase isoform X2 [Takifugu rubripes]|uniref:succinyl-CoA:glutarate CoA-transferase isoform X2 n=1 Tax=Takifugu rubripes TaxID=31033 RepID=UPI001145C9CC|nr:succinate--hydroxymethylglutarate CoA-transferase isoform X2 [Takifugu rubripes]
MSAVLGLLSRGPSVLGPVRSASSLQRNHRFATRSCSMSKTGPGLRPLEGIRVLDLTRVLAGPFATMILGDLGAEVIKVERPDVGDDTRAWGPPFVANESVYFLSVNRNKKSVCVDLKHPSGVTIVQELAQRCDVLVENFLPGKLDKMSLGYEDLSRLNPQLIYCSISGYGQSGPRSQTPGYDSIASAMSGMMHITGPEVGCSGPVLDLFWSSLCFKSTGGTQYRTGGGTSASRSGHDRPGSRTVRSRRRHGRSAAATEDRDRKSHRLQPPVGSGFLSQPHRCELPELWVGGQTMGDGPREHCPLSGDGLQVNSTAAPAAAAFTTKDGHVVVAAGNDKQFVKVCQVLHLRELTEEPRYRTNKLRVQNRKQLIETLSHRFRQHTTSEWLRFFEGSGVPVGPINSIQEVFCDTQVKHNNLIREMKHPTAGLIRVPGPAVHYSSFEPPEATPPPLIGQHTVQVLRNTLSYTDDAIKSLLASKVVAQNVAS